MTAIAAITHEDVVWMAADTASFDGYGVYRESHKLHRLRFDRHDTLIFGTCGMAGFSQAVYQDLAVSTAPDAKDDAGANQWAYILANRITKLGLEIGCKNDDGDLAGAVLLGWRHRLWHITHNCAIPVRRFSAIGSGAEVTLGALEIATYYDPEGPRGNVYDAVAAACTHQRECREPIDLLCTHEARQ